MINTKYEDRKKEIYHFYEHFDHIDVDNIDEVNDHIVDIDLKKEHFENPLEEFYNTISMCLYMIEHELYDEYFFDAYKEILEEYNDNKYDDYFMNESDKELLDSDIEIVNDYLKKDEAKSKYYDTLTEVMDKEVNVKNEEKGNN